MRRAAFRERAGRQTLRHPFAMHLPEDGPEVRTVPELLGRTDVGTAMMGTHVLNRGGRVVPGPLDCLGEGG
jgi:site-specific recombinase XerD